MSHFFELFRKADGQTGDSSPACVETAWQNIEKDAPFEIQRPNGVASLDKGNSSEFPQIPVEELDIQPATRIVFHGDPGSPGADRFRLLRMRLRELSKEIRLKSLLITSPLPHDGKSTIALNLATALAERGKHRVLLIEGDLHHPCLTPRLDLEARTGLAECLKGTSSPLSVIRRLEPLGWYLLAAGKPNESPTELLQTDAFSGLMGKVSPWFDWIVIDAPPVLPLTDALLLKQHTDASLLVARAGQTPSGAVEEAIALLGQKHVLGVVLNCAERLGRTYSYYYYHSSYYKHDRSTVWGEKRSNR